MRVKREWATFAAWESGDEILTIPGDSPLYACGEKDRVVMTNSSEPFQDILMRPITGSTRPTRFATRLPFPVESIDRAYWLSDDQSKIIDGPIPTVDADGNVAWPENAGPPLGAQYSLRGRKHQEYYMFADLPWDRSHQHGAALPRNVQFRRFSLFGQADKR